MSLGLFDGIKVRFGLKLIFDDGHRLRNLPIFGVLVNCRQGLPNFSMSRLFLMTVMMMMSMAVTCARFLLLLKPESLAVLYLGILEHHIPELLLLLL